ncbi:MAG: glycosyltransferase family 2 protein [Deltaproteobacteria bacterium]|nr:glycosyltransferase family 2 protein [Deltaproteobacteria bacterium]
MATPERSETAGTSVKIDETESISTPATGDETARVSVIIPFNNAAATMAATLESLSAADDPHLEVIAVDDCSDDESDAIVERFGAKLIRLAERSGAALARNRGAAEASGDLLLFLDADVAVQPDTVAKVRRFFANNPDGAACFGSYTPLPAPTNFASVYKNLIHHYTHQQADEAAHTFWAGCGAIRREAFDAVGGFDESYEASSVEDIELGYRLTAEGYPIRLLKDLQVTHAKRYTLPSLVKSDVFDRAIPWTRLMAHTGTFYADLNLRWWNILSALVLAVVLPVGLIIATESPRTTIASCVLLAGGAYLLLNRGIFVFVAKTKGLPFTAGFVAMFAVTYAYSVLGLGLGLAAAARQSLRARGEERTVASRS